MFSFTIASDTQQSMYRTLEWSLDSFYVNVTCTVNDKRISADIGWICFKEQVPHVQLFSLFTVMVDGSGFFPVVDVIIWKQKQKFNTGKAY